MNLKKIAIIGLVAIVLVVAVGAMTYRPSLKIDESWITLVNVIPITSRKDLLSSSWLEAAYGCQLKTMHEGTMPDPIVNNFGQNLIIVGGSLELSKRAPWFITYPMTITKPPSQPDVTINIPTWTTGYIHTPKANYYFPTTPEELATKDYGVITVAYDGILRRWLIIIVGWSAESTASGVNLVLGFANLPNYQWIVYRCTSPYPVSISEWTRNLFTYEIVETG